MDAKHFYFRLRLLALLLAAGGCHGTVRDDDASVPAPTRLTLNRALTFAADRSAVFMQGGKLTTFAALNAYAPHCKFELHDPAPEPRTVNPDTFAIVGLREEIYLSQWPPGRRTQIADSSMPSYFVYATVMRLNSVQQPQAFQLTCQHWEPGDSATPRYLTLDEMRQALGDIATLQVTPPLSGH